MDHSYNFAIAQVETGPARKERLNFGIVVFGDDQLSVHAGKNFDKVRALSGALSPELISQAFSNLSHLDALIRSQGPLKVEDRRVQLSELTPFELTELGTFFASSASEYQTVVEKLVSRLVEPEPGVVRRNIQKKTRLLTSLKSALKNEKILANKGEDLESHRIVVNKQLAEGLIADLALKNGAMHIIQTVDASHTERAKSAIQEIGISALIFEQAKMCFENQPIRPRLVYSASGQVEHAIRAALKVAEHQGADIINWESRVDRVNFIDDLSSLAEPSIPQKRVPFGLVNASQRKFLN